MTLSWLFVFWSLQETNEDAAGSDAEDEDETDDVEGEDSDAETKEDKDGEDEEEVHDELWWGSTLASNLAWRDPSWLQVLVIFFLLIIRSCRIPSRNGSRNACMQNLRGWSFLALRMNESCVLIITFIK